MHIGIVHSPLSKTCKCAESIIGGLDTLGYTYEVVDCEEIATHAPGLAERCNVVFDHTDIYQGSFRNRGDVRTVLEEFKIPVVGSSAQAIYLCDNKVRTKECLAKAGIPVPPGIVMSDTEDIPSVDELTMTCESPYILKCGYEHMSKGMQIAREPEEALSLAKEMASKWQQPILVEQLIKGRELRIGVIINDQLSGYDTLPIIDVQPIGTHVSVILEEEKISGVRRKVVANLPENLTAQIQGYALRAFEALELRDYVRFDLRLSTSGEVYFLEANCIPNMHPEQDFASSVAIAGLEYAQMIERLMQSAKTRL